MRKIIVAVSLALGVVALAAAPAFSTQNNPHHEEQDGCDHGHTGKPCRPDPQPDHGKDCIKHGNHGGVNEDHCKPTTTTTVPPTTTTTSPPEPTTTTTIPTTPEPTTTTTIIPTPTPPATSTPEPTPEDHTSIVPVPVTPSTPCLTPDGYPYTTSYPTCPEPLAPQKISSLPHTGAATDILVIAGIALILFGAAFRLAGRRG